MTRVRQSCLPNGTGAACSASSTGRRIDPASALDIRDVPRLGPAAGPVPQTIERADFRRGALCALCASRLSAAYKGVHALLMRCGAEDFRSGQPFDQAVFFDENVDIHHIFPEAWCKPEEASSRKSTTASSTRRLCRRGPTGSSAASRHPPISLVSRKAASESADRGRSPGVHLADARNRASRSYKRTISTRSSTIAANGCSS